jgi:hypothetical protein
MPSFTQPEDTELTWHIIYFQRSYTIQAQASMVSLNIPSSSQAASINLPQACSMIFDPSMYVYFNNSTYHKKTFLTCSALNCLHRSGVASASAWIPLLYDTLIFGLTLYRTVPPIRREEASYIIKRLLEDGILYYRY